MPAVSIPAEGCGDEGLMRVAREVLAGGVDFGAPGYAAHMDPPPAVASVLGDLLAAAMNNNMLSREMSPGLSVLEERLVAMIARELFGLGEAAGGVMTAGGTLANLHALMVARNVAFGWQSDERGAQAAGERRAGRGVILASEHAHTSVHKAAMILGLGTDAVTSVRADGRCRMDPASLEREIASCAARGDTPIAIVATAGTTVTGAIDPLAEIAEIAERHRVWLHVDAIYGGAVVVSRRLRSRLAGIERADSVAFNPHKWWYVARTCSLSMFRDAGRMARACRVAAPYMQGTGGPINLGEISVQGSRAADVIKLHLTLQHAGRSGLEALIDWSDEATRRFVERCRARGHVELACEPDLNVVCFRVRPPGSADASLDAIQTGLADALRREGITVSLPQFRGGRWCRVLMLNPSAKLWADATFWRLIDTAAGVR